MLVLTFRGGEASPGSRLHAVLGAIRAEDTEAVELEPLSENAVTRWRARTRQGCSLQPGETRSTSASCWHRARLRSCRNRSPTPCSVVPARLDQPARRLVELISVVPSRVKTSLLDEVMPDWAASAEEPERIQLLEVDADYVRFRHELARNAIRSSVPIAGRRRLARHVPHCPARRERRSGRHRAPRRGRWSRRCRSRTTHSSRRGAPRRSNRTARPTPTIDGRPRSSIDDPRTNKRPFSKSSEPRHISSTRSTRPSSTPSRPSTSYRSLGDEAAVGRCTRVLSRLHWFAGDGAARPATGALEAMTILGALGESIELARAYSGLSQLAMLAPDVEQALLWGNRALEMATRLGDESTRAHALVNLGRRQVAAGPRRHRRPGRWLTGRRRRRRGIRGGSSTEQPRLHGNDAGRSRNQAMEYARAHVRLRRRPRGAQPRLVFDGGDRLAPVESRRMGRGRSE